MESSAPLEVGVTYWPASVGPYLWQEFVLDRVTADLRDIAARGFRLVRVLLSWDAFMPTDRRPNPRRMRDLESLLAAARSLGIRVLPTLFVQSVGDCVMLPAYAIDRRAARPGVRCLTEARVVSGGPRDVYTDPLLLEVQTRWLEALLAAFSHHPAVAAWDLGYDPASTVRPRRIAQMTAWGALLAERVRAQEEECRLTLSQEDLLRGRAVRLDQLSASVDRLGLLLRPQQAAVGGGPLDASGVSFLVDLAQALSGAAAPLVVDLGVASAAASEPTGEPADATIAEPGPARAASDEMLQRLLGGGGIGGLHAAAWSDWGSRAMAAPPADRRRWWARLGLVDIEGTRKQVAGPWEQIAMREHAVVTATRSLTVDVDAYYANLPDSLHDMRSAWQDGESDRPAIVS